MYTFIFSFSRIILIPHTTGQIYISFRFFPGSQQINYVNSHTTPPLSPTTQYWITVNMFNVNSCSKHLCVYLLRFCLFFSLSVSLYLVSVVLIENPWPFFCYVCDTCFRNIHCIVVLWPLNLFDIIAIVERLIRNEIGAIPVRIHKLIPYSYSVWYHQYYYYGVDANVNTIHTFSHQISRFSRLAHFYRQFVFIPATTMC